MIIPGYENYKVNSDGEVFSCLKKGPDRKFVPSNEWRKLTPALDGHGYEILSLCVGSTKKTFTVHKIVMLAFRGKRPADKHCIAHGDGNKRNNKLENLRYATFTENNQDKLLHGTHLEGEAHHRSKLDNQKVARIRKLHEDGVNQKEISRMINVSHSAVNCVVNRKTWKNA